MYTCPLQLEFVNRKILHPLDSTGINSIIWRPFSLPKFWIYIIKQCLHHPTSSSLILFLLGYQFPVPYLCVFLSCALHMMLLEALTGDTPLPCQLLWRVLFSPLSISNPLLRICPTAILSNVTKTYSRILITLFVITAKTVTKVEKNFVIVRWVK